MERQSNHIRPRLRRCKNDLTTCHDCKSDLNDENWTPSMQKYKRYVCSSCWVERQRQYDLKDPRRVQKRLDRAKRNRMNKSKEEKIKEREKLYGASIIKKYGITLEVYNRILENQNNRCAICNSDKPLGRGRFHVDHCHKTGLIRGILCSPCNLVLGKMEDDVTRLQKAIDYLNKLPLPFGGKTI